MAPRHPASASKVVEWVGWGGSGQGEGQPGLVVGGSWQLAVHTNILFPLTSPGPETYLSKRSRFKEADWRPGSLWRRKFITYYSQAV